MAKPNYSYEKRRKELAKIKKREDKRKKKEAARNKAAGIDETPPEESPAE